MENNENDLIDNKDKVEDENLKIQNQILFGLNDLENKNHINSKKNKIQFTSNVKIINSKNKNAKQINYYKHKYLSQNTDEKNSERNEFINNSYLIKSNMSIQNSNIYKKNLNNNIKSVNWYTCGDNLNNNEKDEEYDRNSSSKNEKKEPKSILNNHSITNKNSIHTRDTNTKLKINSNNSYLITLKKSQNYLIAEDNNTNITDNRSKLNNISLKKYIYKTKNNNNEDSYRNIIFSRKCLFCDKITENEKFCSLFMCNHFFCRKCGKIFYEEKVQDMIKKKSFYFLNCPVFDCSKKISLSLLKLIISEESYNEFAKNIHNKSKQNDNNQIYNQRNKKEIYIMNTEIFKKNENNKKYKKNFNKESNKYLQQNVIDLNTSKKYIYYIGKSFERCPLCKEYSLYGKIDGNYVKCLKCLKKYCKYCHKDFDDRHLDITKNDHCKVFYRSIKDYIQQKCYYKYFFNLLYVIGGYLFILTFFLLKLKRALKIRRIFSKIIRIIIYFFLFIFFLPICIIILPYFPMIISL